MPADAADSSRSCQRALQLFRAVEDHLQSVVIFSEVGILDHLLHVVLRHEIADLDAEAHHRIGPQRQREHEGATLQQRPAARGARLVFDALRRPAQRRTACGHRPAGVGAALDETDDVLDRLAKRRGIGALRRQHQHRQHHAARRGNLLEAAGQSGQIGLRARRCRVHRELAALHRRFRPAEPAAGEHRIGQIGRRTEARDANVEALRAHRRDRHQRDAHRKFEVFLHPGRGRRQRLARKARDRRAPPQSSRRRRRTRTEIPGPSSALVTAAITAAPAMLTAL